MRRTNTTSIEM